MDQTEQLTPTFNKLIDNLQPNLQEVETFRRARRQKAGIITLTIALICCFICVICYINIPEAISAIIVWSLIFGAVIAGIVFWKQSAAVAKEYKLSIITPFVKAIVEDGVYTPSDGISEKDFINCKLFRVPDRYSSEDLITGRIGETRIAFSEVHAQERHQSTNSKGQTRTTWTDIFKGFIFIADFSRQFRCDIQVKRNKLFASKTNRVYLEDPEFEKCFNTYCEDQIEARYILSPSTMRRIMELEQKFKGKNMAISFRKSSILIAVTDNRNHFEASIWQSVFNTVKLKREYEIIRAFAEIVEDLNLNLRIWSKVE